MFLIYQGDQHLLSNGNLNASTMAGSNSVSPRRICSDNNIHMIGSSDNGMIGGGIDPGGGSAAAAVKKRSITSMVETFLDEHKVLRQVKNSNFDILRSILFNECIIIESCNYIPSRNF